MESDARQDEPQQTEEQLAQPCASQPDIGEQAPSQLELLQQELAEAKEKYLLLLAESENQRKRMQRERQELTKHAVERVLVELLHPVDQFEHALAFAGAGSDEVRNWAVGFQMILGQIRDVFSQHGVSGFETKVGEMYDVRLHEAVDAEENESAAPGSILKQYARGYRVGDRTLRPARVKVAKQKQVIEETQIKEGDDVHQEEK